MTLSPPNLEAFLIWWRDNLLAVFPPLFRKRLQSLKPRHDYCILRQGAEVIVLDEKGELIESLPLDETGATQSQSREQQTGTVVTLANPALEAGGGTDETLRTCTLPVDESRARVIDLTLRRDVDVTQEVTALNRADPENGAESGEETLLFYFEDGELKMADPGGPSLTDMGSSSVSDQGKADQWVSSAEKSLIKNYLSRGRCLYVIPPGCLLSLTLDYPLEAESSLDNALRYDLEKHIPMSMSDVVYFHAVGERNRGRLQVHVEVMRKDLFRKLREELQVFLERDLECTTRVFRRLGPALLPFANKRNQSLLRAVFHRRHVWTWCSAILLLALLLFPYFYIKNQFDLIEPVSQQELSRAKRIQAMKRQMETEAQTRSRLIERVQRQPRVIEVLNSLSKRLDKQAWLSYLLLEPGHVRIRGEADSATRVADDLNAAGLFDEIHFVSSIVKNASSGKETFEITMTIK